MVLAVKLVQHMAGTNEDGHLQSALSKSFSGAFSKVRFPLTPKQDFVKQTKVVERVENGSRCQTTKEHQLGCPELLVLGCSSS